MTLALSRIDYTTVGVTSRGTTIIFPSNEATKQPQKFAVADHDGILHIYGIYFRDLLKKHNHFVIKIIL